MTEVSERAESEMLVPITDPTYVPWGFHKDMASVVKSRIFFPIFITGLSGNGKTIMPEQVCAALGREMIRTNISIETDEDDLIGSNTLVDGNVVYREGPVIISMRRGAVLLLDELDRGGNKLMCLQPILEGKPYYNKKTGEIIRPAEGFNVIATANTKGFGSETGKYITAQIMDDALLERFAITVDQQFPTAKTEQKILLKKMESVQRVDEEFASRLVEWANVVRKTFFEGAIDDLISTRRLVHIVNAFAVFGDRIKAIEMCVSRFDEDTKKTFVDLYTKIDNMVTLPTKEQNEEEI